jgi:hypothetical protein
MILTPGEQLILRNQRTIMEALDALLQTPGVSSRWAGPEITKAISRTLAALDANEAAQKRRHG